VAAAPIPWRPLGTLLVARGFLSEEQLEAALDEQAVSGRRLGEILVERGFIPHSTLSLALAEQYGIHPSVERGFGTGLRVLLQGPQPELSPEPPIPLPVVELVEAEPSTVTHLEERLEEQWAQLAAAQEALDALHRLHDRRRAQAGRLLARLRAQRSARLAVLDQLALSAQDLHSSHEALDAVNRLHDRRRAQVLRLLAGRRTQPSADADNGSDRGHLVFVQLERGYELFERDGGPPARDARLELAAFPDAVFVVTNVGRSPLPNDTRACAFAQRAFA